MRWAEREKANRRKSWAEYCEEYPSCLLCLGEVWNEKTHEARNAETIAEEEASVRLFAAALNLEIVAGETLLQLLSGVYKAWVSAGRLLLNPISGKFSQRFHNPEKAKSLASVWTFLQPIEDYNKPLPLPLPPAPVEGGAAASVPTPQSAAGPVAPKTAQEKFEKYQSELGKTPPPTFPAKSCLFSGEEKD